MRKEQKRGRMMAGWEFQWKLLEDKNMYMLNLIDSGPEKGLQIGKAVEVCDCV
jgi:hypothetical protein